MTQPASWFMRGRLDFDWPATREVLEALPIGVALVDGEGDVRFANDAASAFLSASVLSTRKLEAHWYERLRRRASTRRVAAVRLRRRRPNGEVQFADCHARMIRSAHGDSLLMLTLTRCLAGMQPWPRHDRLLAESVRDHAILMVDPDGILTSWSAAAQRMLGYTAAEVIGQPIDRLYPEPEREAGVVRQALEQAREHGRYEEEGWRIRKDGSRIRLHVVTTALYHPSRRVIGFARVVRDLSERIAIEEALQRSEEQLRHAQKMEAVGRLAGGVAHDFNNLITAIRGHAQFILEDLPGAHPSRVDAEEIKRSADRAAALTRQLLTFSRRQPERPVVLDLNDAIREIETLARRLIREDIELELSLPNGVWPVCVDRGHLEQVLMNLLVNARDAIAGRGHIRIETSNFTLHESHPPTSATLRPGEYAQIAVIDDGAGMDAETQARIFEPFFTTKPEGHGTGLGLATVYGIVRQSGGEVAVESEPGRGTTFIVRLPRAG